MKDIRSGRQTAGPLTLHVQQTQKQLHFHAGFGATRYRHPGDCGKHPYDVETLMYERGETLIGWLNHKIL